MNNLFYLLSIIILFGCKTQTKENKSLEVNTDQINQIEIEKEIKLIGKPFSSRSNIVSYLEVEKLEVDLNNDNITDTLIIEKIDEWRYKDSVNYKWDDPGDFHRITISITGGKSLSLLNINGWIINKRLADFIEDFNSKSIVQSNFITIRNDLSESNLIFLNGYHYASNPGLLTIINIIGNKPVMIFNENARIVKYKDFDNNGIKDMVTTFWDKWHIENEGKNEYDVYLLDGGFTYSEKFSKLLSEEIYQKKTSN